MPTPGGRITPTRDTRKGENAAKLFRARDCGTAREALKEARAWRDGMARKLAPRTKQEFCSQLRPDNTSGLPGAYLKRQVVKRGDWRGEYFFWQAQTRAGVKPYRSRSFSITRYGCDAAYELAVQARKEFVAEVEGYIGVRPIPKRFRPAK